MPSIARMNAQLTATASGFASTLKQAENHLGHFKSTFAGVAAATAAYDIGKVAIQGAYHATVGLVAKSIEAQGTLHDQAAALGITTEALGRLQFAAADAGVGGDELAAALSKMQVNLDGAASEGGKAAEALAKIGLNAKDLVNLAPEVAFAKIADGLNGFANANERAGLAQAIFSKGGKTLLPVLMSGSAGLAAAAAAADAYGFSVNQIDNNKIDDAGDAIGHLGKLAEGVGNQLAIGLSPYITAAAEQFIGLATEGAGVGPKISSAIEWVAEGIAVANDYLKAFEVNWHLLKGSVLLFASAAIKAIDLVAQDFVDLYNLLPGADIEFRQLGDAAWSFAGDAIGAFADASQAYEDYKSGVAGDNVRSWFAQARANAQAAAEATGGPRSGVYGGDSGGSFGPDAGDSGGSFEVGPMVGDSGGSFGDDTESAKAIRDATSDAERYYEQTRTAAEKYAAELENINKLQSAGTLDADTAERARDAAQKALEEANSANDDAPDAVNADFANIMSGSAEQMQRMALAAMPAITSLGTSGQAASDAAKANEANRQDTVTASKSSPKDSQMVTLLTAINAALQRIANNGGIELVEIA